MAAREADYRPRAAPSAAGRDARPGGGLGPPIEAPDPLEKYRWYILGGFAVVLAAGAIYITNRSRSRQFPISGPPMSGCRKLRPNRHLRTVPGQLLEALKDELFQLEVEHKQGGISQEEYERAQAALDQTLERALKRAALNKSVGRAPSPAAVNLTCASGENLSKPYS